MSASVGMWLPDIFGRTSSSSVHRSTENWPFAIVMKKGRDASAERRKFLPRSDFLFSVDLLPRAIAEVQSSIKRENQVRPPDHNRMLLEGAALVRLANSRFSAYKEKRNFILVCSYYDESWNVLRHLLFQVQGEDKVCHGSELA